MKVNRKKIIDRTDDVLHTQKEYGTKGITIEGYNEVIDRVKVFSSVIGNVLLEHPLLLELDNPKLEAHLVKVITNMLDAQKI